MTRRPRRRHPVVTVPARGEVNYRFAATQAPTPAARRFWTAKADAARKARKAGTR